MNQENNDNVNKGEATESLEQVKLKAMFEKIQEVLKENNAGIRGVMRYTPQGAFPDIQLFLLEDKKEEDAGN